MDLRSSDIAKVYFCSKKGNSTEIVINWSINNKEM